MVYGLLAILVLLVHLAFVLFVVFGGLLVLRRRWAMWLHLPAVVWGVLIEFAGWVCPLTPLENWLWQRAGQAGYQEGFIEHYLVSVIDPEGLTRTHQFVMGGVVLVLNGLVYRRVLATFRRSGKPTA